MPAPRRFSTEAVVIRNLDYAEADRILTLYTPNHGKLHAIAKGVRRGKSRSAGHLDLFSRCSVIFHQGRNLGVLSQPELMEHFPGLRTDLTASGYAHYVAELTDAFVPDGLANPSLYEQFVAILRSLALTPSITTVRAYELALLNASGYRPELQRCLGCDGEIRPGDNSFSVVLGGILCPDCHSHDVTSKSISNGALKLLRNLQSSPVRVLRLESVDAAIGHETELRMQEYISYRLERRPKSVGVIARMDRDLSEPTTAGSSTTTS